MRLLVSLLALLPLCLANSEYQQLKNLAAAGNGLIKLDATSFDILTSPKRTWSASIQLTALDKRRKCNPCQQFDPSWNTVAKVWSKVSAEHRDNHFFASLDFDDGPTVFQKLGLASAPVVFVYPPAEGPRKPANGKLSPSKYDFSNGFEPGPLAEHLSKHTPIPIPYQEPIDWARWATFAIGILGFAITLRMISPVFLNRWSWALGTVLVSLVMTSGYMFTQIRSSPYSGADGNWIAAGYQNQFGQEVHVVAFIYGLLALSFLMLIMIVPYQSSPQRQRLQVYLWTGVIMIIYSVLLSLFRVKNRGYPFKLFL
ncbi:oligosaccharyl transferase subunit OST3/OST6 family [Laccaria bicolor S238N-H82]|uniref:Oligosaccharyl transferase subunit OST3/OST6 family n=1 Tax=Laccaria bicolor (strain S238N-H82 / ATCC MYA-4686) TaxID=486041 RepID=B0CSG2_LACBS|nr:oligosaccharyl transferase subunit OST3/OST6 family [Laccaria bicolor S238N-H82]EDR14302.1 oligosaccharyl transferase subunit OST3/OST6 family [Laccaria bicolor S238N-H82]|eukprot:XP_001874861.1 oligosaccharyl transferase subunit OST3/OST6 family [Laccaria bicolor S238N-H82]